MSGSMICPTCKGNGFVWVETPEPKKIDGPLIAPHVTIKEKFLLPMKPFGIPFNL